MFYPKKEWILFDDNAQGTFCYVKRRPKVAGSYSLIINQSLYIPFTSVFNVRVISHGQEVFTIKRSILS